jgi:hypothetical protein
MFRKISDRARVDAARLPQRAGRIAFGVILIAASIRIAHLALAGEGEQAARVLVAAWPVAFLVAGLARGLVPDRLDGRDRLVLPALLIPAVGIALLLPLTLHLPFAIALSLLRGDSPGLDGFGTWIEMSAYLAGLAHLAFAAGVAVRALCLVRGRSAPAPRAIFLGTVLFAVVPGIFFFALPPAIVALTGLPFLHLLAVMGDVAEDERRIAATIPPRAIARWAR